MQQLKYRNEWARAPAFTSRGILGVKVIICLGKEIEIIPEFRVRQ